jgi:hypothetical protein
LGYAELDGVVDTIAVSMGLRRLAEICTDTHHYATGDR